MQKLQMQTRPVVKKRAKTQTHTRTHTHTHVKSKRKSTDRDGSLVRTESVYDCAHIQYRTERF